MTKLKFSPANAKLAKLSKNLGKRVYSLDIQSGVSCPFAVDCKSQVIRVNGKSTIKDGKKCKFRCFSASQEVLYPAVYNMRRDNYLSIKNTKSVVKICNLLADHLPPKAEVIRLHVGGDFFKQEYFDAIILLAQRNQHILFYAYTKALPFWVKRLGEIPKNLILTASHGGSHDHLIGEYGLRSVTVVFTEQGAVDKNLPLDSNDSLAARKGGDFALLLHGPQPANTLAAKAWQALKRIGKAGYSRKNKKKR